LKEILVTKQTIGVITVKFSFSRLLVKRVGKMVSSSLPSCSSEAVSTPETISSNVDSSTTQETNAAVTPIQHRTEAELFVVLSLIDSIICPTWSFCICNHGNHSWKTYESWKRGDLGWATLCVSSVYPGIPHVEAKYFQIASIPQSFLDGIMESIRLVRAPHTAPQVDCSKQYVNNVISNLVKAGFLKMRHAKDVFDKIDDYFDRD
jgi:hypothetical protein